MLTIIDQKTPVERSHLPPSTPIHTHPHPSTPCVACVAKSLLLFSQVRHFPQQARDLSSCRAVEASEAEGWVRSQWISGSNPGDYRKLTQQFLVPLLGTAPLFKKDLRLVDFQLVNSKSSMEISILSSKPKKSRCVSDNRCESPRILAVSLKWWIAQQSQQISHEFSFSKWCFIPSPHMKHPLSNTMVFRSGNFHIPLGPNKKVGVYVGGWDYWGMISQLLEIHKKS